MVGDFLRGGGWGTVQLIMKVPQEDRDGGGVVASMNRYQGKVAVIEESLKLEV